MSDDTAPIRALIIRADETWEVTDVVPELEQMYAAVDTRQLERVSCRLAAFYLDEHGKMDGKPVNMLATLFARVLRLGLASDDFMVGTVMVLGAEVRGGNETGIIDETLQVWQIMLDSLARKETA